MQTTDSASVLKPITNVNLIPCPYEQLVQRLDGAAFTTRVHVTKRAALVASIANRKPTVRQTARLRSLETRIHKTESKLREYLCD